MAWIKVISDEEADGDVAQYYEKIRRQRNQDRVSGGPPGLHSLNPKAMWHTAELMWEIMRGPSRLTTQQREMIATVTSLAANCRYWTVAHAEALRREGGDDLVAEQIKSDWRQADLTPAERQMLEYAEKLTIAPSSMTEADVQALREAGWTDRDILDIVQVCAYFNMRVRIVDGLGLQLSERTLERAQAGREHAATLAQERDIDPPPDIWGISPERPVAGSHWRTMVGAQALNSAPVRARSDSK